MIRPLRVLAGVLLIVALVGVSVLLLRTAGSDFDRGGGETDAARRPVPPLVMDAYVSASAAVAGVAPQCAGMSWPILAGIGAVESAHAAGRDVAVNGDITPRVIGPRLDGSGIGGNVTPYPDTDAGVLDGDLEFDRAVGPMQFLPQTWDRWGQDGNGDAAFDPHNIFDASLAAAAYLCGTGAVDLVDRDQLSAALYGYNRSNSYVADVLAYVDSYAASADPPA